MKTSILVAVALAMALLAMAACSPAPTPVPTLAPPTATPQPTATTAQPTTPPQPTATTAQPTTPPQPAATTAQPTTPPQPAVTAAQPTETTAPQPASAPTSAPATATSAAPPPTTTNPPAASPAASPGLYVTGMRLDPVQPAHGQSISFSVSFLNTASGDQNVRWVVFIYRADNPTRSYTQTAVKQSAFPPGPNDIKADGTFNLGSTENACDFFFARVDQIDINNKGTDMASPDGKIFEKGFTICQ